MAALQTASTPRSTRFRVALVVWVFSVILGWPAVAAAASAAPWIGADNAALVGGGSYALSWVLLVMSSILGGAEVVVVGRRWLKSRLPGADKD